MKKVTKSALKAKMFEYFRVIEQTGASLIVTDYGKPVLQVVPYSQGKKCAELFKDLRGKARLPRAAVLESTEAEWPEK